MDPFFDEGDEDETFYCSMCDQPTSPDYELCLACYYALLIEEQEDESDPE
jgi:hypothetical protein